MSSDSSLCLFLHVNEQNFPYVESGACHEEAFLIITEREKAVRLFFWEDDGGNDMLDLEVGQVEEVHSVPESHRNLAYSNLDAQNMAFEGCVSDYHVLF